MAPLLVAGLSGLVLGALSVLLGVAELRLRTHLAQPDDDTQEFPPILAAPRPVRGRW
jgi:hypothetical protein